MQFCSEQFFNTSQDDNLSSFISLNGFQRINFPQQTLIFEENCSLKGVYLIRSGVCKISKMSSNGKYQIIQFLGEKTLLGIRSILNNESTNLKAESLTPVEVYLVPKEYLFEKLNSDIEFSNSLLKTLAHYIKEADNKIIRLGNKKLEERLATFLLYFNDEFYNPLKNTYLFNLKREEMANYIGVATESLIRMLKIFKKKNLIDLEGKQIRIKDKIALKRIASGLT